MPKRFCNTCGPLEIGISLTMCPYCGERFVRNNTTHGYRTERYDKVPG